MSDQAPRRLAHFGTPTIEAPVPGPRREDGFLLRAPPNEALAWDLEAEVVSARRAWIEERQAWWIAASYQSTVVGLVLRTFPSILVLGATEDRLISRDGIGALQGRLF